MISDAKCKTMVLGRKGAKLITIKADRSEEE